MPRGFAPHGDGTGDGHGDGGEGGEDRDARSHGGRRPGSGPVHGRCVVPDLRPVRPGPRGRHRLRRIAGGRRRVTAAGLAVAAAALAAQIPRGERGGSAHAEAGRESPPGPTAAAPGSLRHPAGTASRSAVSVVSAPVRIADAGAVRLLHPGDRVDVIAGPGGAEPARVVARGVRVDRVPRSVETGPVGAADDGALVVLRVPRRTATALAGAGAAGRLAVTLC